mmetsp:Transcript_5972/g.14554  ORF Transcript_5972/g.14554 Transcript_5972/m.14554 type:complete len:322 (+) Transcript_5972:709-1674(+)
MSFSAFSQKLMVAAAACARTRRLGSCDGSIAAVSAGRIWEWKLDWRAGPRSVESCPRQFVAAHRTRGFSSRRSGRIEATSSARCFFMSFPQPSPVWEMEKSATRRYRQSGFARNCGTYEKHAGMIFAEKDGIIARRSSASRPCSKSAWSSPSSSCSEASSPLPSVPHRDHTSRSIVVSTPDTIRERATVTIWCTKPFCVFIIAGAFSASSTMSSTARRRVALSRFVFTATWSSMAVVKSARYGLRKRVFTSEISRSASIAARPANSWTSPSSPPETMVPSSPDGRIDGAAPTRSHVPMQRSMCGRRGWSGFMSLLDSHDPM